MNKTRTWTLAILAGLLGAGDWFLAPLPADENPASKPTLKLGNATVSAALREVDENGKEVKHAFLELRGDGSGTLKVRLASTPYNPKSRMLPIPKIVWEKDIAADTIKSKSIDLGALPDNQGDVLYDLTASTDGKTFSHLLEAVLSKDFRPTRSG